MNATKRSGAVAFVERKSLADQAAEWLRQGIWNGAFKPGQRLTETQLAEEIGLSRGTVRAALRDLAHEGLIHCFPYTGWAVEKLSVSDAQQLCVVRAALDALAARLAAANMTPENAERLEAVFTRLVRAARRRSRRLCVDCDLALHRTIFEIAGNAQLLFVYEQIEQRIRLFVALSDLDADFDGLIAWHQPLVDSIQNGDASAAERIARDNAERNGGLLVDQLRKRDQAAGSEASEFGKTVGRSG